MKITAFFTDVGVPKTGLTPKIDGWEIAGSQVITNQDMTEQASGWYYYEFAGYDETKDYVFRCDGTVTLSGYDRYTFGTNRDDLEMSGKLPTNYFMGSSIAGDKDGNINNIETDTETTIPGLLTTIQADLDNPTQYKTDVSALALEATVNALNNITSASVWAVGTREITGGVLTTPNDYKATGFSTHAAADVWSVGTRTITGGVLTTPNDYKATGFSTHNESAIWSVGTRTITGGVLTTPGDYKANVSGLAPANEYDTELDVILSSRSPANEYDVQLDANMSTRAPANEYDTELTAIQADLDNPSQYMANVSALALETTVLAIKALTDNLPVNTELELIKLKGVGGIWLVAEYHHDENNDNDYIEFWQYGNQTDFDNETKANAINKWKQTITWTANLPQKSKWDKVA